MTPGIDAELAWSERHEELLIFPAFDETMAWELGTRLRAAAFAGGHAVVIDIRRGDECLFFTAMPGTTPANADWARRKRNLVNLLQVSSYRAGRLIAAGTDLFELMGLDPRDYAAHGGCFPVRVIGTGVVGTVTVSGLPQRDDHALVVHTIADLLGIDLDGTAAGL